MSNMQLSEVENWEATVALGAAWPEVLETFRLVDNVGLDNLGMASPPSLARPRLTKRCLVEITAGEDFRRSFFVHIHGESTCSAR